MIKLPASYDISHYKEVPDFRLVEPKPVLFITKATEAHPGSTYNSVDIRFRDFFKRMMEINVVRGCYHFFRNTLSPTRQAEHFIGTISEMDILPSDILVLDVEEYGTKASQMWAWFETVKKAFPSNLLMLYSSRQYLDLIQMGDSEKKYFRKIPVWAAGYPWVPELFSSIPRTYIPDQSKYGPVWLWQYSESGIVPGIKGSVDLNWISPELISLLPGNILGEKTMANFEGKCIAVDPAKVFSSIGGPRVYPDIKKDTSIKADVEQIASGVKYLHLTSPVIGWSKALQYEYHLVESVPLPPPAPVDEYILYFKDGNVRKFIPE